MDLDELPDWLIPPYGGYTADTFLQLKCLPRHTELIDGSLVIRSRQEKWHSRVVGELMWGLDRQAPEDLRAIQGMAIRLNDRQVPEPDVAVITAEAHDRAEWSTNHFLAEDVVLAVEAVAPDTEIRDRDIKPRRYAAAGIRHLWRVEREDEMGAVVYVYELDPASGCYVATGIHHHRLVLRVPFPVEIDLRDFSRRHW